MDCQIRRAQSGDAAESSRVIVAALRETNAKDYSEEVIARVEQNVSPTAVLRLMRKRLVFVAVNADVVVGTASLDGNVARTVFIEPSCQGNGIGRALIREVERAAIGRRIALLSAPSSVTAESFYAKLGFKAVRDSYHGEERTIIMERLLQEAPRTAK